MNPLDIHFNLLAALRGRPATISRGNASCVPAGKVVLGRSNSTALTKNDIRFEQNAQDIMVAWADYAPTGVQSEPQPGDVITVTINGLVNKYEVRPVSDSEQCAFLNQDQTQYRVHCKQIQ